jgi:hypothetical protein
MTAAGAGRDWVAVTLAVGIAVAVNLITLGILWDAITNPAQSGISENATQILIAAFGGITGILGGYIGFRAGERTRTPAQTPYAPASRDEPLSPDDHTPTPGIARETGA